MTDPEGINVPVIINGQMTPAALAEMQQVVHDAVLRYAIHVQNPATIRQSDQPHPPPEAPVNLASIEADVRDAITTIKTKAEEVITTHLPKIEQAAKDAENDPLVQALEAVFLPADVRQTLAVLVGKLGTPKDASVPGTPAAAEPDPATAEETAQAADAPPAAPGLISGGVA